MLSAFIVIALGALIIWFTTEPPLNIMMMLWVKLGQRLFQVIVVHSDDDSGENYAVTFTNDDFWQEKMLKDLKNIEEKQVQPFSPITELRKVK